MSRLTGRGYSAADATEMEERVYDAHSFDVRADVYSMGSSTPLQTDLPVVGGRLRLDSSDPHRRVGTIEVAGEDLIPTSTSSLLTPFDRRILLYVRTDRRDGTWFPWLKMGEYVIESVVVERPSTRITVDIVDYSARVDEYLFTAGRSMKGKTLRGAIEQMVNEALPNRIYSTHASDRANTTKFANYVAEAGRGRWDVALEMADRRGHEVFFDANGDLVIRGDRTDDDEDVIPGVGPDIGSVSNPVGIIKEGEGGNLVALTATTTRRGAVNGVKMILTASEGKPKKWGHLETHSTGAVAWGDAFGRVPLVRQINVRRITSQIKSDYTTRAKSLLRRRRGVVRYLDMDIAPMYWIEPDDTVKVVWSGGTEYHFVASVEMDLAGRRPMRIRTRQLAVTTP